MTTKRIIQFSVVFIMLGMMETSMAFIQEQQPMYNTAKQKLMEGKSIIGGTVYTSDPNIYCAMANAGFDFTWIEMQHSPLTHSDVARFEPARGLRPCLLYECRPQHRATFKKQRTLI